MDRLNVFLGILLLFDVSSATAQNIFSAKDG
jgi:hypothetical protein